jgi:class 3 adenylate cyclase
VHIDITTEFLVTALRRNPIGKSGIAWLSALSSTNDAVYAISWDGESTTDLSQYNASALNPIVGVKSVAQLEHPLARQVVADLGAGLFRDGFTGDRLIEHRSNGVLTTVVDIPAPQAPTLQLRLAVVIKESDYLSGIEQQRVMSITLAVVAVLVIAAIMSAVMWWIAAPLDVIADDMNEVAALRTREAMRSTPSFITEVTKLQASYAALSTAVSGFVRYVPKDVVRELVTTSQLGNLVMKPTRVTVLFTDIRGFTSICEAVSPDVLAGLVRMYFTTMTKAVASHGGVVDKFIGDAVMALWGAPIPVTDMELLCTMCALWMQRKCTMPPLASTFSVEGHALAIRAGVAVGNVLAGNMGSAERMNYTVIGDSVNLAARLESLNRQFGTGIMVSSGVASAVNKYVVTRLLARVSVVGKVIPENIYEVLGAHGGLAARAADVTNGFSIPVDDAAGIPVANVSGRNVYASEGGEHFDSDDALEDAAVRAQEMGLSHGADELVVQSPIPSEHHQVLAANNTPPHSTVSVEANRSDLAGAGGSISLNAGTTDMPPMNGSSTSRDLGSRVAVICERASRRLTASDEDTRFAAAFTQAVEDFHSGKFDLALATLEMEVANAPKWRDHKSVLLVQRRIVAAIENNVDPKAFDATFVADSK